AKAAWCVAWGSAGTLCCSSPYSRIASPADVLFFLVRNLLNLFYALLRFVWPDPQPWRIARAANDDPGVHDVGVAALRYALPLECSRHFAVSGFSGCGVFYGFAVPSEGYLAGCLLSPLQGRH